MIIFGSLFFLWVSSQAIWIGSTWNFKSRALITGFIYEPLVHAKRIRGCRQAFISLVEFGGIPSVYFRVDYLPDLHRYGK